jgi:phosphohistidine phosphatase
LALTEEFQTVREIAPGASYASVLAAAGWPDGKGTVLVVGHQPTLGHVAALLLSGEPGEWSVKKGAIYWLTNRARGEQSQVVLRAALSPELV